MTARDEDIERTLGILEARVLQEPGLATERAAARHVFFADVLAPDALAERRFREWFLLERPSEAWQTPPAQEVAHAVVEEGLLEADAVAMLVNSFCGVFEVTSVVEGQGAWLRDLLSGGEHPLVDEAGSFALALNDVLIGRLFVLGPTANRLSRAAALYRDAKVRKALERDLEAARARRRGVMRLSQRELEAMFWSPTPSAAIDSAVERARTWLSASGIDDESIAEVFAELASTPIDEQRWVIGAQDVLGDILEHLAFDTDVDLEPARRLLLAAWIELAATPAAEPPRSEPELPSAAEERDVRDALAAFDRGRSEGRDLEKLFADLERDLGLEDDDDAASDAAPDFPGVVGAVVEEFLWETEREQGTDAARALAPIRKLADYGQGIGVFENLGVRDLLTFAAVWLPERGELGGPDDARASLAALRAFSAWANERQGVELVESFRVALDALDESLPRITDANRFVEVRPDATGVLYEVKELGAGGACVLADAYSGLRREVLRQELAARLAVGDRVRAIAESGKLAILRCYPPESAAVLDRE
ncbi:MAG: hypothetical protein HZA52_03905 [Planctomycetes bacterium]|nr:hypothetical protein [Planctomycetota bacterium]